MKLNLIISIFLIGLLSISLYYSLHLRLIKDTNDNLVTLINIDKIRFSSKISNLSHFALHTYLEAIIQEDKNLVNKSISYYEASIGFITMPHIKNQFIINEVQPLIEESISIIRESYLTPISDDIKKLSKNNKQIDILIEDTMQKQWVGTQDKYVDFVINQEKKQILYIVSFFSISLLVILLIYFILKNNQLTSDKKQQEKLLMEHSKAASMGEMIGLISHQWKQPLSLLSMVGSNIRIDIELDNIDKESLKDYVKEISEQVEYLSSTIDTFRNFFKDSKERTYEFPSKIIDRSLNLILKSFINNGIEVIKNYQETNKINIITNELIQVFVNILNNSKDAFEINEINDKKLWINLYQNNNSITIEIEDTAGGVPNDKIEDIFNSYVTTKSESGGTGLGLYIVKKIIVNNFHGFIEVHNTNKGAKFTINLPLEETKKENI